MKLLMGQWVRVPCVSVILSLPLYAKCSSLKFLTQYDVAAGRLVDFDYAVIN